MNFNNCTQKSIEAIQLSQSIARSGGHQQLEQLHLLAALLKQDGGLTAQLLKKMGIVTESLSAAVDQELRKLPAVSGGGDQLYLSGALDETLTAAENLAAAMHDDYVSVEHLFLALLHYASAILYRLDGYSPEVQRIFLLNPVYCAIKYVRVVTIDGIIPDMQLHILLMLYGLAAIVIGGLIYKKKNHMFLYYV